MHAIYTVLLAAYAVALPGWQPALRIYSGVDDNTAKYPFVVVLKETYPALDKICTGSIITEIWVLSAAHCFKKTVKYIQFGNMSLPLAATEAKSIVLKMVHHPGYSGLLTNDIGLLLVKPVYLTKYAQISAIDYKTLLGQVVEYAGFGMTFIPKRASKNKVQHFIEDIFRPLQIGEGIVAPCGDYFRKNLICAKSKCSHTQIVLPGDSGGPLFFENKVVGVAFAIVLEAFEQAFTPVSPFLTWIHSVVSSVKSPKVSRPPLPTTTPTPSSPPPTTS